MGVSVVNALSTRLTVEVVRGGSLYRMAFAGGEVAEPLVEAGGAGKRRSGTSLRFWPDPAYFDSPRFAAGRLKHLLRAKAVLCPGLTVRFTDAAAGETETWQYEDGLGEYLASELADVPRLPEKPFTGSMESEREAVDWAVAWLPEAGEGGGPAESYVNLIPTPAGGTHVNGLRAGLTEAVREFCEFRNLLPRGRKLAPEDVWDGCSFVLSVKLADPQFAGQTKERLASRSVAAFVSGVVKDAFSLWLNRHPESGEALAELVIGNAQRRVKKARKVTRKRVVSGPALPGKLTDCVSDDPARTELFLVEGDSAGGSAKQARDREFQAVMPLRGKILNAWEVDPAEILGSQEIHDISVALGVEPGAMDRSRLRYHKICILADADSDGLHIATLLCALFLKHFRPLVEDGRVFVAMPPLYRIDVGKDVFYALDEEEREGTLDRIRAEKRKGKVSVTRFKGLGEMSALQLRETTMAPETRRLVQLTLDEEVADGLLDMLLAKKRAADRRDWLERKGHEAEV